jgi:hypothetical protein
LPDLIHNIHAHKDNQILNDVELPRYAFADAIQLTSAGHAGAEPPAETLAAGARSPAQVADVVEEERSQVY